MKPSSLKELKEEFEKKFLMSLLPLLPMIPNRNLITEIEEFISLNLQDSLREQKEEIIKKVWNLDNPYLHSLEPGSKKEYNPDAWHDWEACKEQVVTLLEGDE
jgi:hypothetical protein